MAATSKSTAGKAVASESMPLNAAAPQFVTANTLAEGAPVLVIDADAERRSALCAVLSCLGERPQVISEEALAKAPAAALAVIGRSVAPRAELLRELQRRCPGVPALLIAGDGDEPAGIFEEKPPLLACIPFPCPHTQLLDLLQVAGVYRRQYAAQRPLPGSGGSDEPVGRSHAMIELRTMVSRVADKEVTVLITGPSGAGKEIVARSLHRQSARRDAAFVPVNCGAIPPELLESELFGHEKGAFTGAVSSRAGRFELAQGGTLFLDEIGDMPLNMQVKILRVLQEREFERVGSSKSLQADVRIVAATHKNLEQMMAAGQFREDLYYRLNVFPIAMPALCERAEDIPLLIDDLLRQMAAQKRGTLRFNSAAIDALCRYRWPGNVRELANLVERLAILHPGEVVGVADLPPKFRDGEVSEPVFSFASSPVGSGAPPLPESGVDLKATLAGLERDYIEQALGQAGGVVARAAELLGIRRTTLVEKMRKYRLQARASAKG